ncbi:MAG: hypothetical protein P4L10_10200 [Acidobacteriaceae bacterium]|nr:hypothetical protein [Acidobacteriaceae bacterium]
MSWLPFGPEGGDVRSFAEDPTNPAHVYMGTANGWIYETTNGGAKWQRLARIARRDDLVVDSIVVDTDNPKHILVGAWVLDHPDGGIFVSDNGGHTWSSNATMSGQSIRALAAAPSNAKILIAGALSGVYRSTDSGRRWEQISPPGSTEIHEIESLAVDPHDPQVIYAGTWHLPWKTTDGGEHWKNIKNGVIEDSDVFSIIVDERDPQTIYASACSGIYKSQNAGELFKKVQGIPKTARRTRVLMQDPVRPDIVFAGTTEGLFRSSDAGQSWLRMTRPEDVINDIYIDPKNPEHMLVATDRGGVLMSDDGGFTYKLSNSGFSARQISAYAADPQSPANIYVGVVNDKDSGGVFASRDGGISWQQRADGLNGRDVFALTMAPDNTLLAGTNHGIFSWHDSQWQQYGADSGTANVEFPMQAGPADPGLSASPLAKHGTASARTAKKPAVPNAAKKIAGFDGPVYALMTAGYEVYAATQQGLLESSSSGAVWKQIVAAGTEPLRYLAAGGGKLAVADLKRIELSHDSGKSWKPVKLPAGLTQISSLTVDGAGEIWVVGGEGIWFSEDDGARWQMVPKLNLNDVNSIYYDATGQRVLVTANNSSTFACAITVADKGVQCWDTGWHLRMLRPVGDHMVAATLFDGIVVQPRMVESK